MSNSFESRPPTSPQPAEPLTPPIAVEATAGTQTGKTPPADTVEHISSIVPLGTVTEQTNGNSRPWPDYSGDGQFD